MINAFILCNAESKNSKNTTLTDYRQFRIRLAWNLVILSAAMLGHEELLNFSIRGIARYDNQNAAGRKNTRIIGGYVINNYEFPQSQLIASFPHQQSTIAEGK